MALAAALFYRAQAAHDPTIVLFAAGFLASALQGDRTSFAAVAVAALFAVGAIAERAPQTAGKSRCGGWLRNGGALLVGGAARRSRSGPWSTARAP